MDMAIQKWSTNRAHQFVCSSGAHKFSILVVKSLFPLSVGRKYNRAPVHAGPHTIVDRHRICEGPWGGVPGVLHRQYPLLHGVRHRGPLRATGRSVGAVPLPCARLVGDEGFLEESELKDKDRSSYLFLLSPILFASQFYSVQVLQHLFNQQIKTWQVRGWLQHLALPELTALAQCWSAFFSPVARSVGKSSDHCVAPRQDSHG